jgi:hypothetical protein
MECNIRQQEGKPGFSFSCMPDTGSTRTIILLNLAKKHNLITSLKKPHMKLMNASGKRMQIEGLATIQVQPRYINNKKNKGKRWKTVEAIVLDAMKDEILLGWGDLKKLGCISDNFPMVMDEDGHGDSGTHKCRQTKGREVLIKLLDKYKDVISDDLSKGLVMPGKMGIFLKKDTIPVAVSGARRPPPEGRQEAGAEIAGPGDHRGSGGSF